MGLPGFGSRLGVSCSCRACPIRSLPSARATAALLDPKPYISLLLYLLGSHYHARSGIFHCTVMAHGRRFKDLEISYQRLAECNVEILIGSLLGSFVFS